jgi:hypothetical protein
MAKGDATDAQEYAWLAGYITSLITSGLRRRRDRAIQVRPFWDEEATSCLAITTKAGRRYVLSITPVADDEW